MNTKCYYVANPSRDIRANVLQTYHTSRNLLKYDPDIEIILAKRSSDISTLFKEIKVYFPVNKTYGDIFAYLKKYSRIWNYVEGSLTTFLILVHISKSGLMNRKIVYCREFILNFWLSLFLPLINGKLIYEAHGFETDEPNRAKEEWFKPILKFMEKICMTRPSAIVCISPEFLPIMLKRGYTKLTNSYFVIPNAFDSESFYPTPRLESLKKLKLDSKFKYIVYSGMTYSHRNLDKFIVEVSKLKLKNTKVLLVGGQENEIKDLKQITESLKLTDKIVFIGKKDQRLINHYLSSADCLVIPGVLNEDIASPLKLFEYLAVKRPIVCPDIPAFRDIISNDSVYYFKNDLASNLTYVLTHKKNALKKAENAYKHSKKFTFVIRTKKIYAIMKSFAN